MLYFNILHRHLIHPQHPLDPNISQQLAWPGRQVRICFQGLEHREGHIPEIGRLDTARSTEIHFSQPPSKLLHMSGMNWLLEWIWTALHTRWIQMVYSGSVLLVLNDRHPRDLHVGQASALLPRYQGPVFSPWSFHSTCDSVARPSWAQTADGRWRLEAQCLRALEKKTCFQKHGDGSKPIGPSNIQWENSSYSCAILVFPRVPGFWHKPTSLDKHLSNGRPHVFTPRANVCRS